MLIRAGMRIAKHSVDDHNFFIAELASVFSVIAKPHNWKDFYSNSALEPQDRDELAEKLFLLITSTYSLYGVSEVLEKYLKEHEAVDEQFNIEEFVENLERLPVTNNKLEFRSVYGAANETSESFMQLVCSVVSSLTLQAKFVSRIDAPVISEGFFGSNERMQSANLKQRVIAPSNR